ncbi:MAG TPA: hypothetical protein VNA24_03635 [Hyalangium sp.]|nr:hypothetical protein [Hyalangium sp.]
MPTKGYNIAADGDFGPKTAAARNFWLKNNASKYGFQNDVRGEYWHWTFKG